MMLAQLYKQLYSHALIKYPSEYTRMCVCVKRGHSRNANFGEKNLAQKQLRVYLESKKQTQNQSSSIPTRYSFDQTYL